MVTRGKGGPGELSSACGVPCPSSYLSDIRARDCLL